MAGGKHQLTVDPCARNPRQHGRNSSIELKLSCMALRRRDGSVRTLDTIRLESDNRDPCRTFSLDVALNDNPVKNAGDPEFIKHAFERTFAPNLSQTRRPRENPGKRRIVKASQNLGHGGFIRASLPSFVRPRRSVSRVPPLQMQTTHARRRRNPPPDLPQMKTTPRPDPPRFRVGRPPCR